MAVNYLNNKELMNAINESKKTYCYWLDKKYSDYDIILENLEDITPENIELAKQNKITKLKNPEITEIPLEEITFRIMDGSHIPYEENAKGKMLQTKINFRAYKHFAFINGKITEVGRSHWKGDLVTGYFCQTHGKLTNNLAKYYTLLVEKNAQKSCWRNYSYVNDMKSTAVLQLVQAGLKFDEAKGNNPFAYCTQVIWNSFKGFLSGEKSVQKLRDELLVMSGAMPSINAQIEGDFNYELL